MARAEPDDYAKLISHVYKVLLTRGMIGTVLYSTDPQTLAKFHELVDPR